MKTAILFGALSLSLSINAFADESAEVESAKVYIGPNQLAFTNQTMEVCLEGEWIPVNTLYSDANGLYIKPLVHNYPYTRWVCKCGYNNYGGDKTCQRWDEVYMRKCGLPRPE